MTGGRVGMELAVCGPYPYILAVLTEVNTLCQSKTKRHTVLQ